MFSGLPARPASSWLRPLPQGFAKLSGIHYLFTVISRQGKLPIGLKKKALRPPPLAERRGRENQWCFTRNAGEHSVQAR